jgi:hypothetical protein
VEIKHVICFSANRIRGANGGRFIELTEGNDFRLRDSTAYYNNTSPYNRVKIYLGRQAAALQVVAQDRIYLSILINLILQVHCQKVIIAPVALYIPGGDYAKAFQGLG